MHLNNYIPVLVERSARIAAHKYMLNGVNLSKDKKIVQRTYRRKMNIEMYLIINGFKDVYEFDDSPSHYSCKLTDRDVW